MNVLNLVFGAKHNLDTLRDVAPEIAANDLVALATLQITEAVELLRQAEMLEIEAHEEARRQRIKMGLEYSSQDEARRELFNLRNGGV